MSNDPVWERIRHFWTRWADPSCVLWGHIPHAWLAFDNTELVRTTPRPCVLFCLDPDYFTKHEDPQHLNSLPGQTYQDVVGSALDLLLATPLSQAQRCNLGVCFDSLPSGGQIIHVSVMLARTPSVVRLNLTVPKQMLVPYLHRIGWTGSFAELGQLLDTYCVFPERVKIQLTIGETLSPRLDFEFHCKGAFGDDSRWQTLLNAVVQNGLCTSGKHEALHAWPGSFRDTFPDTRWPTRFQKWTDLKIIAHPDASLEAKAYLGFMPNTSIF